MSVPQRSYFSGSSQAKPRLPWSWCPSWSSTKGVCLVQPGAHYLPVALEAPVTGPERVGRVGSQATSLLSCSGTALGVLVSLSKSPHAHIRPTLNYNKMPCLYPIFHTFWHVCMGKTPLSKAEVCSFPVLGGKRLAPARGQAVNQCI